MPKTLVESTVSNATARAKLAAGMHWRGINADVHLGYRRGKRAGHWLVRWYVGDGKYKQETIGSADDGIDADGVDCLTFSQAKAAAAQVVEQRKATEKASLLGPIATVRSVVEAYCTSREARENARGEPVRKRDARNRLAKHVLSTRVASREMHSLSESDLRAWRDGLPANLATATVRRLVNDFKAALNAGAVRHRAALPAEISVVIKNGLSAPDASPPVARDKQALSDADLRRLVDAAEKVDAEQEWDGDLLRMVVVLAATGGRFSQVRRMDVGDVQAGQSRLMLPVSRKGRGTKHATHVAMRVGSDVIGLLLPAITGRPQTAVLLERWRHKQVPGQDGLTPRWVRDSRAPWTSAPEMTRGWRKIIEVAKLPNDTVPYALRHSSIVRQLRSGLPVRLVAALHDTSTRMIETHYAAAIVDALDELSAGAVIPLVGQGSDDNVVRFKR